MANSSEADRQTWIHDIKESAIALSQQQTTLQPSIVSNDLLDKIDSALSEHWKSSNNDLGSMQFEKMHSRTNTIVHVCWQRNCTISAIDYRNALTVNRVAVIGSIDNKDTYTNYLQGFLQRIFASKVQEQQWLAKTLGRIYSFLFVFLQILRCKPSSPSSPLRCLICIFLG